jgi:TctA family transporter
VNTGVQRFSFGVTELSDGIGFIVVAVGVFAIGEIISNLCCDSAESARFSPAKVTNLWPTKRRFQALHRPDPARHRDRRVFRRAARHRAGDRLVRVLHGREEDRRRSHALREGRDRGVESANNADAQCKFIPMLTSVCRPQA